MEVAKLFERKTAQKKRLTAMLKKSNELVADLESQMNELIENEKLPSSFKGPALGASIYTREEIWVSPKGGDHAALTAVLRDLGLVEYLPSNVNSQSMSAYVREHYNKKTGEFDGLPQALIEALEITKKQRVIAAGV